MLTNLLDHVGRLIAGVAAKPTTNVDPFYVHVWSVLEAALRANRRFIAPGHQAFHNRVDLVFHPEDYAEHIGPFLDALRSARAAETARLLRRIGYPRDGTVAVHFVAADFAVVPLARGEIRAEASTAPPDLVGVTSPFGDVAATTVLGGPREPAPSPPGSGVRVAQPPLASSRKSPEPAVAGSAVALEWTDARGPRKGMLPVPGTLGRTEGDVRIDVSDREADRLVVSRRALGVDRDAHTGTLVLTNLGRTSITVDGHTLVAGASRPLPRSGEIRWPAAEGGGFALRFRAMTGPALEATGVAGSTFFPLVTGANEVKVADMRLVVETDAAVQPVRLYNHGQTTVTFGTLECLPGDNLIIGVWPEEGICAGAMRLRLVQGTP